MFSLIFSPSALFCGRNDVAVAPWRHFFGQNVDALVAMHNIINHLAVNRGKQRIVFSVTHIRAGMDARTALAYQYIPGKNNLACIFLNAQTLGIAITSVAARAATFFMSHGYFSSLSLFLVSSFLISRRVYCSPTPVFLAISFFGFYGKLTSLSPR